MRPMSAKRAAALTIALALAGAAVSAVIASIHAKLASSAGYASFCNVSESVNCDVVLTSDYAHLAGVPVAWWALLTYVVFVIGAVAVVRAERASRRRQAATALFGMALWSFAYSVFLGWVSLAVLRAVCLLCSGLYVLNAALVVATWLLFAAVRAQGRGAGIAAEAWRMRTRWIFAAAAMAVLVFLSLAAWEGSGRGGALSAEEVAQQYPEFYRWYMGLPVIPVSVAGGHARGRPASVVIVEFSDFECGHCAKAYRNLKRVLPRFGSDVQLIFRHFPLDASCNPAVASSFHRYACLAAMASECAAAQGRFWEYHDLLFENQSALERDSLIRYAERLGLDRAAFLACLDSDAPRRRIADDTSTGQRLGVASTPTLFMNGRIVTGALEADKLEHAIRIERAARSAAS